MKKNRDNKEIKKEKNEIREQVDSEAMAEKDNNASSDKANKKLTDSEFVRKMIADEDIKAPESLQKGNIIELLEAAEAQTDQIRENATIEAQTDQIQKNEANKMIVAEAAAEHAAVREDGTEVIAEHAAGSEDGAEVIAEHDAAKVESAEAVAEHADANSREDASSNENASAGVDPSASQNASAGDDPSADDHVERIVVKQKPNWRNSRITKPLAAICACLVLCIAAVPALSNYFEDRNSGSQVAELQTEDNQGEGITADQEQDNLSAGAEADHKTAFAKFKDRDDISKDLEKLIASQGYDESIDYEANSDVVIEEEAPLSGASGEADSDMVAEPNMAADGASGYGASGGGGSGGSTPKSAESAKGSQAAGASENTQDSDTAGSDTQLSTAGEAGASGESSNSSKTYTQVKDVDEADIIKTNGNNIFCISGGDPSEIKIFSANKGKTKQIGKVSCDPTGKKRPRLYINNGSMIVPESDVDPNTETDSDSAANSDSKTDADSKAATDSDSQGTKDSASKETADSYEKPEYNAAVQKSFTDMYVQGDRLIGVVESYAGFDYFTPYVLDGGSGDAEIIDEYTEDYATNTEESGTNTEDSDPEIFEYDASSVPMIDCYLQGSRDTEIWVYDISDPSHPELLDTYRQSGYLVSSRIVDGKLILVTDYYVDRFNDDFIIPKCGTMNGDYGEIKASSIGRFTEAKTPEYVVVGSVDIKSGKRLSADSKAVMGASDQIYCTIDTLYVTSEVLDSEIEGPQGVFGYSYDMEQIFTSVLRVDISGDKVKFTSSGKVKGYIDSQWAMDERDGYFRIATTSYKGDETVNNLYVLDEDLKKVGSVTGFARDEHIEAVRYIKDKAYVITYEETDPLFIIDLSNPKKPKIQGEVKIDGFSTLLVPVSENTLLGIGFHTEGSGDAITEEGLKLVLFDISDPSKPKVKSSKIIKDCSSEVQYDHKALLVNPEMGYYAIPYEQYGFDYDFNEDYTYDFTGGAIVFTANDKKIKIKDIHQIMGSEGIARCVYIDDYIYAMEQSDHSLHGFKVNL